MVSFLRHQEQDWRLIVYEALYSALMMSSRFILLVSGLVAAKQSKTKLEKVPSSKWTKQLFN